MHILTDNSFSLGKVDGMIFTRDLEVPVLRRLSSGLPSYPFCDTRNLSFVSNASQGIDIPLMSSDELVSVKAIVMDVEKIGHAVIWMRQGVHDLENVGRNSSD